MKSFNFASFIVLVHVFSFAFINICCAQSWPVSGQSANDLRSQPNETHINTSSVSALVTKWVFTTGGDVSATPSVVGNVVYVPDWSGHLYAIDAETGNLIWSHQLAEYNGVSGSVSRTSPAVVNNELIIGDQIKGSHSGASVMAVSATSGTLLWITKVETHPAAIITGPAVVAGTTAYVGVSSGEESFADQPGYACCTFRGSVVALDTTTGRILWKTYVVPSGYSGGAIWQQPAVDTSRGLVYVGTGNNYSVPASVERCEQDNPGDASCTPSRDYFDSALALDTKTGAVKWHKHLYGYDVWTQACLAAKQGVMCPDPTGPDYDMGGSGPNVLGNIVGIGQKSGIYWALNSSTGALVWSAVVGPGGSLGGIQWGTASDGKTIYAAIANANHKSYKLISGQSITWGAWSAINVATGKILWQTPDPTSGTIDESSLSVANGVVFAGSFDVAGHMYALNSATGKILWSFASGGSVLDGPSIVNGVVYWGSGYSKVANGSGNDKVYAFALSSVPVVSVTSPTNGSKIDSPVHYVASAVSANCAKGIASMRIYTAPHITAFTTSSNQINTNITLSPGTYNTVIQSWDNCGGVGKSSITITVQ
ncbi:MAG TPA: PQQ-binding-like beta-propeller repeat protein [Terriglobales bacterium]|jgi:polyvinyl alcohol dehydrogenase (cytochrome)